MYFVDLFFCGGFIEKQPVTRARFMDKVGHPRSEKKGHEVGQ